MVVNESSCSLTVTAKNARGFAFRLQPLRMAAEFGGARPYIMQNLIASAAVGLAAVTCASAASAQTANFRCPSAGTLYIMSNGVGVDTEYTATGQDGDACVSQASIAGDQSKILRVYWGLIGSVDKAGDAYAKALNLKSLWPLRVGNSLTQDVHAIGYNGQPYTTKVSITVAAYEKVTVEAGTFDAFRIEELKEGDASPRLSWWAPSVAMSVKQNFPDWQTPGATRTYTLSTIKQ